MDEMSEPEEGEACYYKDDDNTINPDTAFSYFDEKIINILGQFKKDFEGAVSAESLGSKYGQYGSFLSVYEHPPSRVSEQKRPQRNSCIPRSPYKLSMEGAPQTLKAPPTAPSIGRPGNALWPTGDIAAKHNSRLSSAQVAEKSTLKDESFNNAGVPTDQKMLKVRIKMGSDDKAQKNAAIYSGLGLDYSPSSSLGNSPEGSGETKTTSQETTSELISRILQVMTTCHIPGGVPISPLHDSLLNLLIKEKERPTSDSKAISSLKACQENAIVLIDKSILGNGKQLKKTKENFPVGKSEKLVKPKREKGMNVVNNNLLLIKKKSEDEIAGEQLLSSDLKHKALSTSMDFADSMEATARAFDVSVEANQDGSIGRLFSSNSAKEDSLESLSGKVKNKKRNAQSSSVEKGLEQSVVNFHNNASGNLGNHVGSKGYQSVVPLKWKENPEIKVGQIAKFHVRDRINIPSEVEKKLFEGKKKSKSSKKTLQIADAMKESLGLDVIATPTDTTSSSQGYSTGKSKKHKLKLQKDITKVKVGKKDALNTNFEQKREHMKPSMRPLHNGPKDSDPVDVEADQNAHLCKSTLVLSDRAVDKQLPGVVTLLPDNSLASQAAASTATASVVIQENWVQCDRCHKWRLLPFDTRPEQLPEKWLCGMLNWLPGMNRCDISEEETTKALNALYQIPVSENQNNTQSHVDGTTSLVTSAHLQHLDQNNCRLNSPASSIRGKKKFGIKEVNKVGSNALGQFPNSKANQQLESLKSRSLNDMTSVTVESNVTKKSSIQQSKNHLLGGEAKQAKMKNKRESDPYAFEGSKKTKTEDIHTSDKHQVSNLDPRRVGFKSSTGWSAQVNGKNMQNYNEYSISEDVKRDMKGRTVVSVKIPMDHTQPSSDGEPLELIKYDKRDSSLKKRKLEDWQDIQNDHELYLKEESSESGFRNQNKPRKFEGKQSRSHRNDDDNDGQSNRNTLDNLIGGTGEVKNIDLNQKLSRHKKKATSQKTSKVLDSSRRSFGTGQITTAATSSSSKVSGSRKTGGNFEEARDSPVESVSSSPMRTSYPEKLASSRGDGSGKNDDANGGIPSNNFRKFWDKEGTVELSHSCIEVEEKASGDLNPKSHESSTLDNWDRGSIRKISIKTKPSSRLRSSHLHNCDTHFMEKGLHAVENSNGEVRMNMECHDNALFSQKSDKGSTTKESEKPYTVDKVDDPKKKQEDLSSRQSLKNLSYVDLNGCASLQETIADCKHSMPDKSNIKSSKDEKNSVGKQDPSGQWSNDGRMKTRTNIKHDGLDTNSTVPCITKGKTFSEQNPIQDFDGQAEVMQVESSRGMSKSSLCSEVESQLETRSHRTVLETQNGIISGGFPVNGSFDGGMSKALKQTGKVGNKNGSNYSLGQQTPDLCVVRDLNTPTLSRVNSLGQITADMLKDAKELRNQADRLKSSGFVFESNEIYFQAALKFLAVAAALLETGNTESGGHGVIDQIQVFSTVSKLCEMCAQEYERRQEMAAAALAYKCMEVANLRIVYCKHSTCIRDWKELHASLHAVAQGESPSSSASDVDNNLNNLSMVDKALLVKGNVSHVSGAHTLAAGHRPSFIRLLDFTQDANSAMEASIKTQTAFAAAYPNREELQNTDCISYVKKAIDHSFHDVNGVRDLVEQAMEAINRSSLAGAKD